MINCGSKFIAKATAPITPNIQHNVPIISSYCLNFHNILEEMFYSCDNLMNIDKSKFISEKIKKEEDRPRWFNKLLYENTVFL